VLRHLFQQGLKIESVQTPDEEKRPLEGKKFLFTGQMDRYTRRQAKAAVERLGARVTSSVSSQTDYVVVGENPGGKRDAAEEQHVEIIDEQTFKKMLH